MEDLQIGREVASSILSDPVASACGRLVLKEDFVLEHVGYSHSPCSFPYVYVDSSLVSFVAARCGRPYT